MWSAELTPNTNQNMTFNPIKDGTLGAASQKIGVDLTMMHLLTQFVGNPSRNVTCRVHTRHPPKYDLWPYKRWNTVGSIKKKTCVWIWLWCTSILFDRNPSRNVTCRAAWHPPKYVIWPYKRWITGGSITKNNRSVDLTLMHLHTKFF